MANQVSPAENFSFSSSDNPVRNSGPELSAHIFHDLDIASMQQSAIRGAGDAQHIILDNPFAPGNRFENPAPMLDPALENWLVASDMLQYSTPIDNIADGTQADFKLIQGTDGNLYLEPTGNGDPLADGKVNIEIDTDNKSLIEAIKQADQNMKEYIREMISYWVKNHPGKPYPGWWQDILDSQPLLPDSSRPPVPIQAAPSQFRPQPSPIPEAPPAPKEGWQPDYRGGNGRGYGSAGSGGSGGYYHGGGTDSKTPKYTVPNEVPPLGDSGGFIDRVAKTLMKNEGALNANGSPRFDAYNPDDNGGISVGLRQWHAGGALPELLNAWQDKNPEKFQQYFHGSSPAQINAMSSSQFASHPELVQGMKSALADKEFQQVQTQLITDWVKREVKMGMDLGLTGEKELATFVDIANQYGQSRANQAARIGSAAGDQAHEMNANVRGGKYAERFALISANFSDNKADLSNNVPEPGSMGTKLANAVKQWDSKMAGTGYCATAVQRAMADVGLNQFVGSGDAWNMLGPMERSGLFVRVPESQAAVGDVILRPPSKDPHDNSIYGDISVVTARHGDKITQTNDATYQYEKNNARYDGKAVFLRYVGTERKSV